MSEESIGEHEIGRLGQASTREGIHVGEPVGRPPEASPIASNTLFGNASVEEADVIGLASTHHGPDQNNKELSDLLAKLAKEGDVVLVENIPRGEEVPADSPMRSLYEFPEGVELRGWEDKESLARAKQYVHDVAEAFKTAANELKNGSTETTVNLQAKVDELPKTVYRDRNPSLLASVADTRSSPSGHRTFVIAGENHFTEDPALVEGLGTYRFCVVQPVTAKDASAT